MYFPMLCIPFLPSLYHAFPTANNFIDAAIKDHDGADVTSSFQVRLYQDLHNSTLHDRRRLSARPINDCQVSNADFRSSHCMPRDGVAFSMQSWRIYCHVPHNVPNPETGEVVTMWVGGVRDGHCESHEICIDSLDFNAYNQLTHVARCVSDEDYVPVDKGKDAYPRFAFKGKRAKVMLSNSDRTPIEVDKLDVRAGTVELNQVKTCRDCVQLRTDPLQPDTDRLKIDATLLTAGAAAGVLWLAIMSG